MVTFSLVGHKLTVRLNNYSVEVFYSIDLRNKSLNEEIRNEIKNMSSSCVCVKAQVKPWSFKLSVLSNNGLIILEGSHLVTRV